MENNTTTILVFVLPAGYYIVDEEYLMKKKSIYLLIVILALTAVLASCDKPSPVYTITFDSNGGSAVAPITKAAGESVSAPTPPTKEGYTFDGWYTDDDTLFTFTVMPSANITLCAKWTLIPDPEPAYQRTNYEGEPDEEGGYILFGEYPQTVKADDVTITAEQDARGYYLGSDGCYYAKATAAPYYPASPYSKFSNGEAIEDGTDYYFKVEPIKWRILSESGGKVFLLCETVLTDMRFDDGSNNYANSEIRAWLNDIFYEIAFNNVQKSLIQITEVDNSAQSTGHNPNQYAGEDTSDKVFLPSFKEITDSAYNFAPYNNPDFERRIKVNDYSKAAGAYIYDYGSGYWWLRSPDYDDDDCVRYVDHVGKANFNQKVDDNKTGVVPVLYMNL
jgi:uncharacterized repeat protein (TIGR02543 family)